MKNPSKVKSCVIALTILSFFVSSFIFPFNIVFADQLFLPKPGVRVGLSPDYNPPVLKGINVYPNKPFKFDFILDRGQVLESDPQLKIESAKLVRYFLSALTTPNRDLWVNLSPYEKNKIIPESFGLTEMGRDLLAQDYVLKQITSSLMYPEEEFGKKLWSRIYQEAAKQGIATVPVNTFNKVWIVPDKVRVYEKGNKAFILNARLKVMMENDYLAENKNLNNNDDVVKSHDLAELKGLSAVIKETIIPELEKEVNEGKNFAMLRQVYQSLILATWFKKRMKDSILGHQYVNQRKVNGIGYFGDKEINPQIIYEQYLKAFKKGVYNYIKTEQVSISNEPIPRKYFAGGFAGQDIELQIDFAQQANASALPDTSQVSQLSVNLSNNVNDNAMAVKKDVPKQSRSEGVQERKIISQVDGKKGDGLDAAMLGGGKDDVSRWVMPSKEIMDSIISRLLNPDRRVRHSMMIQVNLGFWPEPKTGVTYIINDNLIDAIDQLDKASQEIIYRQMAVTFLGRDGSFSDLGEIAASIAIENFGKDIADAVNEIVLSAKAKALSIKFSVIKNVVRVFTFGKLYRDNKKAKDLYLTLSQHTDNPWRTLFLLRKRNVLDVEVEVRGNKYNIDYLGVEDVPTANGMTLRELISFNRSRFLRYEDDKVFRMIQRIKKFAQEVKEGKRKDNVLRVAVVGIAYGQDPITEVMRIERVLRVEGLQPGQYQLEVHLFEKASKVFDKIKSNQLVYPVEYIDELRLNNIDVDRYFKEVANGYVRSDFLTNVPGGIFRFHDLNLLDADEVIRQSGNYNLDLITFHNVSTYIREEFLSKGKSFEDLTLAIEGFFDGVMAPDGYVSYITEGDTEILFDKMIKRVMKKFSLKGDLAMNGSTQQKVGGIDLTEDKMKMDIEKEDALREEPVDLKALENVIIDGLFIKKIEIKPIRSLPVLLEISG